MKRLAVLVGLLGVLVFSAVGSASASAAECPGTGKGVVLCSGGHVLEGTFAFTSKQRAGTKKKFEIEKFPATECETVEGKGEFVATKTAVEAKHWINEWNNCKVVGRTECKMQPIIFDGHEGTGSGPGLKAVFPSSSKLKWYSMEGETKQFTTWYITGGGCGFSGNYKLDGWQNCELRNGTVEAQKHQVDCLTSGSNLEGAGKTAFLEITEEFELSPGKDFSFQSS